MTTLIEIKVTTDDDDPIYYAYEVRDQAEAVFLRDLALIVTGFGEFRLAGDAIGLAIGYGVPALAEYYRGYGVEPGLRPAPLAEIDLEALRSGEPTFVRDIELDSRAAVEWDLFNPEGGNNGNSAA